MHPAIMEWWQSRLVDKCGGGGWGEGAAAGCGPGGGRFRGRHSGWHGGDDTSQASGPDYGDPDGGGHFGVRRPLRFLAYKLELDERQVAELARILDTLKT